MKFTRKQNISYHFFLSDSEINEKKGKILKKHEIIIKETEVLK